MELNTEVTRYRHPWVRDLAWTLLSPPLLSPVAHSIAPFDNQWAQQSYLTYRERLLQLDQKPAVLERHLQNLRDKRLGGWFENLLSFWLSDASNADYRLICHALQITEHRRTLGELDFLVLNKNLHHIEHWEVAIKFYLGQPPGVSADQWIGPGSHDRLDLKLSHLERHQLALPRQPSAHKELNRHGWHIQAQHTLIKGRLYYPAHCQCAKPTIAAHDHLRGAWVPLRYLEEIYGNSRQQWIAMTADHWMSPLTSNEIHTAECLNITQLKQRMSITLDSRPLSWLRYNRQGEENLRLFITPDQWPLQKSSEPGPLDKERA